MSEPDSTGSQHPDYTPWDPPQYRKQRQALEQRALAQHMGREADAVAVTQEEVSSGLIGKFIGITIGIFLIGAGTYVTRAHFQPGRGALIPTIDLAVVHAERFSLSMVVKGAEDQIPVHVFSENEAARGFTAPIGDHVIFTCPAETTPDIGVDTVHIDSMSFQSLAYWGYEYSEKEKENEGKGESGPTLFDGRFWYSQGLLEREPSRSIHATKAMTMQAGKKYYLLIPEADGVKPRISCLDRDSDRLNDAREDRSGNGIQDSDETNPEDADSDDDGLIDSEELIRGTNPVAIDTDGDRLQDGTEVGLRTPSRDTDTIIFAADNDPVTVSDPLDPDSDDGGEPDGVEDRDGNGRIDEGERNPLDPADDLSCGYGTLQPTEQCDDGNITPADGCSPACTVEEEWTCNGEPSTCAPVPPPKEDGELIVLVRPNGAKGIVVGGQEDVSLLTFDAFAQEPMTLQGVRFRSTAGPLSAVEHFTLWVDSDGDRKPDTVLQSDVRAQDDLLNFDALHGGGYAFAPGAFVRFGVTGTIAEDAAEIEIQIAFATEEGDCISAAFTKNLQALNGIRVDTLCAEGACPIRLKTGESIRYIVRSQGSLIVGKSIEFLHPRQLLAGGVSDPVLVLSLKAQNEPIEVTGIDFTTLAASRTIDRLELYQAKDAHPFAVALRATCSADTEELLCVSWKPGEFVVKEGEDVTVVVRPALRSDSDGGVGGERIQVSLAGSLTAIQARGTSSQKILAVNNGDTRQDGEIYFQAASPEENPLVPSFAHEVVLAKILSIEKAGKDADGTVIPEGEGITIGGFTFSAAQNINTKDAVNSILLSDLLFTVRAENVVFDVGQFRLSAGDEGEPTAPCTVSASGGLLEGDQAESFPVVCSGLRSSAIGATLASGERRTIRLTASLHPDDVLRDATVQVLLENFVDSGAASVSASGSHIHWLDADEGSQRDVYWVDSAVTSIPSTIYTVVVPSCGNGLLEEGELCDEAERNSDTLPDACRMTCILHSCGDGVVDSEEECDDGNIVESDGCSALCVRDAEVVVTSASSEAGQASSEPHVPPVCADRVDNDTDGLTDSADPGCHTDGNASKRSTFDVADDDESDSPRCGNGVLEDGEECDDGNAEDGDWCMNDCAEKQVIDEELPACVDSIDNDADGLTDEEDPGCFVDGNALYLDTFTWDDNDEKHTARCGNAVEEGKEECDDGNVKSGDGCSAVCAVERTILQCFDYVDNDGDGLIDDEDPGCYEDENASNAQAFDGDDHSETHTAKCGNGAKEGSEQCDDGNVQSGDGCNSVCAIEGSGDMTMKVCSDAKDNDGDSFIDFGDPGCHSDGNILNPMSFDPNRDSEMHTAKCGNGAKEGSEQCDDGNVVNVDGCSSICKMETAAPDCGDGKDNDGDTFVDAGDPGCHIDFNKFNPNSFRASAYEGDDAAVGTCADGKDNDGDMQTDIGDAGCHTNGDRYDINSFDPFAHESVAGGACSDAKDNDGDGFIDASDPGCHFDGNALNTASYEPTRESELHTIYCGNGAKEGKEQCDDGNMKNGDGCSSACAIEGGGDGMMKACSDAKDNDNDRFIDASDPGCHFDGNVLNISSYDPLRDSETHTAKCGNGAKEGTEQCDDGNTKNGDGCSAFCLTEATSGKPHCSDNIDNDGDGFIDVKDPACHSDGNALNPSSYTADKSSELNPPYCGDGARDPWEGCDDGNVKNGDGCSTACQNEGGSAAVCVDGNDNDGDGFIDKSDPGCHTDNNALNDTSFYENGTSESNAARCGDGAVDPGESCDDANTVSGDGCSGQCLIEGGGMGECSDGIDNDGDIVIDMMDPGCHSDANANNPSSFIPGANESGVLGDDVNTTQCSDGRDNDADTLIDAADPGCHFDLDRNNPNSYAPFLDSEDSTTAPRF